jgi:hypothetical protein
MSLCETGHSNGAISLQALLDDGAEVRTVDPGLSLQDIAVYAVIAQILYEEEHNG